MPSGHDITVLLGRAASDSGAQQDLLSLVYDQLRAMAQARMRTERRGHTLDATGLVHEAYLRLLSGEKCDWNDRAHFFRTASECMRRILVDHARARKADKRGGGAPVMPLSVVDLANDDDPARVLALDEALTTLASEDARAAEIVKLRFFGGLSAEETAKLLDLSERTVMRDWAFARARLFALMEGDDAGNSPGE